MKRPPCKTTRWFGVRRQLIVWAFGLLAGGLPNAWAQPAGLEVLAKLELDRREPEPQWFEYTPTDGGLVTIAYASTRSSRYLNLYKYDASFRRVWTAELLQTRKDREVVQLQVLGDRILTFVEENAPANGMLQLVVYRHDLSGKRLGAPHVLWSYPRSEDKPVRFSRSINQQNLILWRDATRKRANEQVYVLRFAADATGYQSDTLALPYPDNVLTVSEVKVSNAGRVAVLAQQPAARGAANPAPTYRIFLQEATTKALKKFDLPFDSVRIAALTLKLDRNEELVVAGLYNEPLNNDLYGVVLVRLEPQLGRVVKQALAPLSRELFEHLLSTRLQRERQTSFTYVLKDMILRSDGGVVLMAEERYLAYQQVQSFSTMYTRQFWVYEDVLVASVSGAGELEWNERLAKHQEGESTTDLSYSVFASATDLVFVYAGRQANLGYNLFVQRLSVYGKLEAPRPLLDEYSLNDKFYQRASQQLTNSTAILVLRRARGRRIQFLKLGLPGY